jgi:hypothetical protein
MNDALIGQNEALGGNGGFGVGGTGNGGGIFINAGTLNLIDTTIQTNRALGGFAGSGIGVQAAGEGGGLYIAGGTVNIDAFTLAHITNNVDSNGDGFNNVFP